ncbi:hypothetical protein ACTA71_005917 [Dictyostelium dimigraforme]
MDNNRSILKLLVLGDSKTGKTTMMMTYSSGSFPIGYIPTNLDAISLNLQYEDKVYDFDLWDQSGLEEYDKLRPLSYVNKDVLIICFSIDSPKSFENVSKKWILEIRKYVPTGTPIILLGTKSDLREDVNTINSLKQINQQPISYKQGLSLSKEIKATIYLECSSLLNQGVSEIFKQVCRCHFENKDGVSIDPTITKTSKCIMQ